MNIIETVQKNLGFSALKKIDPNLQESSEQQIEMGNSALAQAAIPAVLLGIYNRLEQEPDLKILDNNDGRKFKEIFGPVSEMIERRIILYSKIRDKNSSQELEHIAAESIRVVKEKIGMEASESSIRNFVAKNKKETLLFLPPSLDLGTILKNNNLDDRTGKMEGPVSGLARRLEEVFNTSDND